MFKEYYCADLVEGLCENTKLQIFSSILEKIKTTRLPLFFVLTVFINNKKVWKEIPVNNKFTKKKQI